MPHVGRFHSSITLVVSTIKSTAKKYGPPPKRAKIASIPGVGPSEESPAREPSSIIRGGNGGHRIQCSRPSQKGQEAVRTKVGREPCVK